LLESPQASLHKDLHSGRLKDRVYVTAEEVSQLLGYYGEFKTRDPVLTTGQITNLKIK